PATTQPSRQAPLRAVTLFATRRGGGYRGRTMPHVDLLELPYFEGISMDGLVSLVDLMKPITFEEGQTVVEEGDRGPQPLYIATAGKVLVSKRGPDGKERALAELESPTLFGEIELFCQIPPVCSAKAVSRVQ